MATLVVLAAGCSGRDHTDVCVGPTCPSYDGAAGQNGGGTGGVAGSAGTNGVGGSPEDPLPDAGADAAPPAEPCEVAFVTPTDANGAVTLGESDDLDADACGSQFTARVVLDSNATTVNLFINGSPLGEQVVAGGSAEFDAPLGNRGSTSNVLRADAVMADGRTCSVTFGADLLVDCPGPSCSIESPVANDKGYLNASQDGNTTTAGLQTDIVIATEAEHAGQPVRLEIDTVFESVNTVNVGSDGSATFTAVTLEEGPRTVRAECRDAQGVVTLSPPAEWNVDLTACGLSIGSVAGGANPITRSNDLVPDASNGLQVTVAGNITGDDCKVIYVGECGGDFSDIQLSEGPSDFEGVATLSNETGSVLVCARIEDLAGNVSSPDTQANVNVDVTPCTTTLVVAGGANPITPAQDGDPSPGLQVSATGQTVGSDCATVRVGICNALSGSPSALAGDGSFALVTTLASVTGSVDVCAEISDSAGNLGVQQTPVNVNVEGPSLTIESPLDQAVFTTASADCDPVRAGLQIGVTGLTSASQGSTVEVGLGLGARSETQVVTGAYTACVDAPQGNSQTLTATVLDDLTGLGATASIVVSVDSRAPGTIGPLTVNVTGRRQGTLNVSWASALDTDGDPLVAYRLRCSKADITDETTWGTATEIPVTVTPALTAGVTQTLPLSLLTGSSRFCVMRGEDDGAQLTALTASSIVANPFLRQTYTIRDDANVANAVANVVVEPLGDINGDAIDDFMYSTLNGNIGGAQVFFGSTALNPSVAETADITINRTDAASAFGGEASGLGDISGDGIPDFAVSARFPATNTVYVFFGRDGADPAFDSVINATGAACPAGVDLCVVGNLVPTNGGLFSWDVHGANFDGSGANDLVISARSANSVALGAGRVYVLLGGAQLAAATNRIVTIPANADTTTDEVDGFIIDPPASRAHFGFSVTALNNAGPDDLIIGANGSPPVGTAAPNAAVFFLAGRAYSAVGGSGLISIASTELVEVQTGTPADFGNPVRALGDVNGDGTGDFGMGHNYQIAGAARVFLRNGAGSTFSVLDFTNVGPDDDNYGFHMANGEHASLGLLGDLNNDGFGDFLLGSDDPDTVAACPGGAGTGSAQIFYGGPGFVGRPRDEADFTYKSTQGQVVPNFVGDINDDGFKDFALLDSGCAPNVLILMY